MVQVCGYWGVAAARILAKRKSLTRKGSCDIRSGESPFHAVLRQSLPVENREGP